MFKIEIFRFAQYDDSMATLVQNSADSDRRILDYIEALNMSG
jgi:hypothetical protein